MQPNQRGRSRALRIGPRVAGLAEGYTPTWTQCENAHMLVSQPLMFGYANDYNWVSVQHGVFKLIGGSW